MACSTSAVIVVVQILSSIPLHAQASASLLLTAVKVSPGKGFLESRPDQLAVRALLTLDSNEDSMVDMTELRQFAQKQGLSIDATQLEFQGLDQNGDSFLDAGELSAAMGSPTESPKLVEAKQRKAELPAMQIPRNLTVQGSSRRNETLAARKLAEALATQQRLVREASDLEKQAAERRAQHVSLKSQTEAHAGDAAAAAAKKASDAILLKLAKLQDEARTTEMQVAMLRSRSYSSMKYAGSLVLVSDAAWQGGSASQMTVVHHNHLVSTAGNMSHQAHSHK